MYTEEIKTAKEIAKNAGEIMLQYFDGDQSIEIKEDDSPVTIADILVNKMVIEKLAEVFPEDGIVGEEKSTSEYGMGRKWICDPIDGTVAFVWGVPTSMFSLALVLDGRPVVAVAYDPYLDRMYTAIAGGGAFCNNKEIHVSSKGLRGGHIAVTAGPERLLRMDFIPRLQESGSHIAVFSGCVYKSCLVGRGKFEGYIESRVSNYDMAAVDLIVHEAGGKVTSTTGEMLDYSKHFNGALVSNGKVHDELISIYNKPE
jgi:fructose-1,6-bisphosphatase/inositol monophosphatase family enzyme